MGFNANAYVAPWLKADDLQGGRFTLTIADSGERTFKSPRDGSEETKPWIAFRETDKRLSLNVTNLRIGAEAWGPDSDAWQGHRVELYVVQTGMGPGIQIAPVPQQSPQPHQSHNQPPGVQVPTQPPQGGPQEHWQPRPGQASPPPPAGAWTPGFGPDPNDDDIPF